MEVNGKVAIITGSCGGGQGVAAALLKNAAVKKIRPSAKSYR